MTYTYDEMKRKTLALIEERNEESELLTDDPDIATKYMDVTNQVLFELARNKKIPMYIEKQVNKGDLIDFATIKEECGKNLYQFSTVKGVNHDYKANGTVLKILEDGIAEIDFFVYPTRITEENASNYEFEISEDVLEIMPYGIAADLLKSDVSTEYGAIYATRYAEMLQRLDPRNHLTSVYIDGGVMI